jgi:hypothetical protein
MRGGAAALLALAAPVAAQPAATPAPSVEFMTGEWAGAGTIFGRASRVGLTVKRALGGKAVTLNYRVEAAAQGAQAAFSFAGHAIYRIASKGRWEGRWLDSGGAFRDLSAEIAPGRMNVTWGSAATEIGRTSYALEDGVLILTDQVLRASGQFETFATARLTRK